MSSRGRVGDGVLIDSLLKDGLTDPFGNGHMGALEVAQPAARGSSRTSRTSG